MLVPKYGLMMDCAMEQAEFSRRCGGLPIGAALFEDSGALVCSAYSTTKQDGLALGFALFNCFGMLEHSKAKEGLVAVCTKAPNMAEAALCCHYGVKALVVGDMDRYLGGAGYARHAGIAVFDLKLLPARRLVDEMMRDEAAWRIEAGE